jgi:hypothetical protein
LRSCSVRLLTFDDGRQQERDNVVSRVSDRSKEIRAAERVGLVAVASSARVGVVVRKGNY